MIAYDTNQFNSIVAVGQDPIIFDEEPNLDLGEAYMKLFVISSKVHHLAGISTTQGVTTTGHCLLLFSTASWYAP